MRVIVALDGRSARTRRLAAEAGLEDVGALASLAPTRPRSCSPWFLRRPPWDSRRRSPRRPRARRRVVADLNAVVAALRARDRLAPRRRRDRGRRRRDLRPAARRSGHDTDLSLGTARRGRRGPPARRGRARRRRRRARARLRREDVHRVRLQGPRRAPRAGASHRARLRRRRARPRRSGRHGPRRPRPARARRSAAPRQRRGGTSRRWRRSPRRRPEAGLTPDLFRALAVVYADLAERALAVAPEDVQGDIALATVLDRLSPRQTETEAAR